MKGPRIGFALKKQKKTETGMSFPDPMVEEAAAHIVQVAAKSKDGSFKLERERGILSVALGNPEHPGRVWGISSRLGWKEGFAEEWQDIYKKRDRYKKEMKDYF